MSQDDLTAAQSEQLNAENSDKNISAENETQNAATGTRSPSIAMAQTSIAAQTASDDDDDDELWPAQEGCPPDGTYSLGVIRLRPNSGTDIPTRPNYQSAADYTLGENGNTIQASVSVRFRTQHLGEQRVEFLDSKGNVVKTIYPDGYTNFISPDGNFLILRDSPTGSGARDSEQYMFVNPDIDPASLKGQHIQGYFNAPWTGVTWSFNGLDFEAGGDEDDGGTFNPCFLPGTLIETPSGLVKVEELQPGDEVVALDHGQRIVRKIIWVGSGHISVIPHLSDDMARYPVCLLKDALDDNVPDKDLWLTSEHCLLLEGRFVPVRMLVNGRSIFYDRSIENYTYYHFRTENHSVIKANNVEAETFLNSGEHKAFLSEITDSSPLVPEMDIPESWADAAAPLDVSRDFVEPLYRKFKERATNRQIEAKDKEKPLIHDPDICVVLPNNRPIAPSKVRVTGSSTWFGFKLDKPVPSLRLRSRESRPADVIGPFVDDRRSLGVLVGQIHLFSDNGVHPLSEHLHDPTITGWFPLEQDGINCRWTRSGAVIPLPEYTEKDNFLAIEVLAAGPYQKGIKHQRSGTRFRPI